MQLRDATLAFVQLRLLPGEEVNTDRRGKARFSAGLVDGGGERGNTHTGLLCRLLQRLPKSILQRDGGAMPCNRERALFGARQGRIDRNCDGEHRWFHGCFRRCHPVRTATRSDAVQTRDLLRCQGPLRSRIRRKRRSGMTKSRLRAGFEHQLGTHGRVELFLRNITQRQRLFAQRGAVLMRGFRDLRRLVVADLGRKRGDEH